MTDVFAHVNWLAILAAAVANFVLGGLWFGLVVARQYPVALGIADRPPQKPGPLFLVGPFVCGLVTIVASAVLLQALGVTTLSSAAGFGALVGIGYLAPMTLNIAINPLFPRPFHYWALNAPYFVIGSVLACLILTALS